MLFFSCGETYVLSSDAPEAVPMPCARLVFTISIPIDTMTLTIVASTLAWLDQPIISNRAPCCCLWQRSVGDGWINAHGTPSCDDIIHFRMYRRQLHQPSHTASPDRIGGLALKLEWWEKLKYHYDFDKVTTPWIVPSSSACSNCCTSASSILQPKMMQHMNDNLLTKESRIRQSTASRKRIKKDWIDDEWQSCMCNKLKSHTAMPSNA